MKKKINLGQLCPMQALETSQQVLQIQSRALLAVRN